MRYRLINKGTGNQIFFPTRHALAEFAAAVIKSNPCAVMEIYEEKLVETIAWPEAANTCYCKHNREAHRVSAAPGDHKFGSCNLCNCKRFDPIYSG